MRLAIIGGSGSAGLVPAAGVSRHLADTPYGPPSGPLCRWQRGSVAIEFLARHGEAGTIPPHGVNYRANLWALAQRRPELVLAINAVGGIDPQAVPGCLVLPDQLVDYTWGRDHTFVDAVDEPVRHVDFTRPVSTVWHGRLVQAAQQRGLPMLARATYGVTQGPRLETAAEIDRLERDGCQVVGMTAMPEAGLARELGLDYVICAVVVNFAAGRGPAPLDIHACMAANFRQGMAAVAALLEEFLGRIQAG